MKKAKIIMVQGTGSHVGKSITVAALCRIFAQDGYSVCPFKSQNMALNSFVTEDGEEMGRAQVMQAEAAGIKPRVFMNPILIKPVKDTAAQIIFMGKPVKNMTAVEYDTGKKTYLSRIGTILEDIKKKFDIIVIEGAGSPAEINLLENDIANMAIAELADCPVMLVGDIDKGGIFASFYGTVKILPPKFQKLFKCLLINKFRGDKSLLMPGVDWIEKKLGLPVAGVVPYYRDIILDEEDSVNLERQQQKIDSPASPDTIRICIFYLPHISNFTDFNILEREPGISLYYIKRKEELKKIDPHIIIIPGSKSTMSDLEYLRESGIEEEIKRQHEQGRMVMGICGGYQMLGRKISDPQHTESKDIDNMEGMGFIDMETVLCEDKFTRQVEFRLSSSSLKGLGEDFSKYTERNSSEIQRGYEIHTGKTDNPKEYSLLEVSDGNDSRLDGYINYSREKRQAVIGTYVHGVFDNLLFRELVLDLASEISGIKLKTISEDTGFFRFKESQYDKLADHFRKNMDMEKIRKIIGLSG